MTQFDRSDDRGTKRIVSDRDVIIATDRDQDGAGDFVVITGGVERLRMTAAGVGSGFGAATGGSIAYVAPSGDNTGAADYAAITAALASTGVVTLAAGSYHVNAPIALDSQQTLRGSGITKTTIFAADGANTDVIKTANFDTLTGGNTNAGAFNFLIADLTISGNKANNSSGYGIRIYGYGYTLQRIRVKNCCNDGVYSEWSSLSTVAAGDSMEATIIDFQVHDNTVNGITLKGPHDSYWANGSVYKNGAIGINPAGNGGGLQAVNVHSWGNQQTYAWKLDATAYLSNCVGEGASSAQVYIGANKCSVSGGRCFAAGATTPVGIEIAASATDWRVDTLLSDFNNAGAGVAVKFTSDGGGGHMRATIGNSNVSSGSPAATTTVDLDGSSPGATVPIQALPGLVASNFPPNSFGGATALTAGTLYTTTVKLRAGQPISNIWLAIAVAASGTAPTHAYVGLADPSGNVVAVSSDLAANAAWASTGFASLPLGSTYVPQKNGDYQVLVLIVGAWSVTQPTFERGSAFAAKLGTAWLCATAGTSLTAIPNAGTALTLSTSGAQFWFAGAS